MPRGYMSRTQIIVRLMWCVLANVGAALAVGAAWWMVANGIKGWGYFLATAVWLGASIQFGSPKKKSNIESRQLKWRRGPELPHSDER